MTFVCLAPALLSAEDITTPPVGFNKVTCLPNSDTIVGVPLRTQGSIQSALASQPTTANDTATLTLASNALTPGALTGHYLKFIDGTHAGRWYDILTNPANTANTLSIGLNGDSLGSNHTGNKVLIARYWTLNELFPPAGATTSWTPDPVSGQQVPNGHAIVASTNTSLRGRRTELLFPDLVSSGTNLASSRICYISGSTWIDASGAPAAGSLILWPNTYFTIRHPLTVANSTVFRTNGEVDAEDIVIPLRSLSTGPHDNFVALLRPLNVRLDALNLLANGAFVPSAGSSLRTRRDELLVFDNAIAARNRSASAIYYHDGTNWLSSSNNSISNHIVIQAGYGFIIRKARTTLPSTSFWINTPNY